MHLFPARMFILLVSAWFFMTEATCANTDSSGTSTPRRFGFFSRFLGGKQPDRPPVVTTFDLLAPHMTDEQRERIGALWKTAVEKNYIHHETGLPRKADFARGRTEQRFLKQLYSSLEEVTERAAKLLDKKL